MIIRVEASETSVCQLWFRFSTAVTEYLQHIPLQCLVTSVMTSVHLTAILEKKQQKNSQSHFWSATSLFGQNCSPGSLSDTGPISWPLFSNATISISLRDHIHKNLLNKCVCLNLKAISNLVLLASMLYIHGVPHWAICKGSCRQLFFSVGTNN